MLPGMASALLMTEVEALRFDLLASSTGSGATITIPGSIAAGDLCIIWNRARDTDAAGSGASGSVAAVTPSGFTNLSNDGAGVFEGIGLRLMMHAKKLLGSETTVTGMNDNDEQWAVAVFRPNKAWTSFAYTESGAHAGASNPSVQTISIAALEVPVLALGEMASTGSFSRSVSPSMNELNPTSNWYCHYYNWNAGPQNHSYDMSDGGDINIMHSGYLTFTE